MIKSLLFSAFVVSGWSAAAFTVVPPQAAPKSSSCLDQYTDDERADIVPTMSEDQFESCFKETASDESNFVDHLQFARGERVVVRVSVASRTMSVFVDGAPYAHYYISPARLGYHTKTGSFSVGRGNLKVMHYSSEYHNSPMPHSIFYSGGYAIHGTFEERNIGRPASHGCIRLRRADAAELFGLVHSTGGAQIIVR
jgi:hypothetical protein